MTKKNNPLYVGKMTIKDDDENCFVLTLKNGVHVVSCERCSRHTSTSITRGHGVAG